MRKSQPFSAGQMTERIGLIESEQITEHGHQCNLAREDISVTVQTFGDDDNASEIAPRYGHVTRHFWNALEKSGE
jgi:hypothetical protein